MKSLSVITVIAALALLSSCAPKTNPDKMLNQKASLSQSFKLSDKQQKVITTFINSKEQTTAILYGNAQAYLAANAVKPFAGAGESFTLVTWHQQDDQHWFGARIPGDLLSAETLTLKGNGNEPIYEYQKYMGKQLVKLADTTGTRDRVKFILSQKASITP